MGDDRAFPIEALYPRLETASSYLQFGILLVLDGAVSYGQALDVIGNRLHLVGRRRKRWMRVPFAINRPVWVDDEDFDLEYHVRHVAVPAPGDEAEFKKLVATLVAERLDLGRPPWRIWLVEGLAGGRTALLRKAHHVLWDGMSEMKAIGIETDPTPDIRRFEAPSWTARRPPSPGELRARALRDRLGEAKALFTSRGPKGPKKPKNLGPVARLGEAAGALRKPPETPLHVPIGSQRRVDWLRVPTGEFRTIRRAFGGTTNDIALAVLAGAMRRWLELRCEPLPSDAWRVACPVASPQAHDPEAIGNFGLGPMLVDLPVHVADAAGRLAAVRKSAAAAKETKRAPGGGLLGFVPGRLIAGGLRALLRRGLVNMVVSNVPAPRRPVYFAGARVAEFYGLGFPLDYLALFVTLTPYDGHVVFGFNADYHVVHDLEDLRRLVAESTDELVAAARAHMPAPVG